MISATFPSSSVTFEAQAYAIIASLVVPLSIPYAASASFSSISPTIPSIGLSSAASPLEFYSCSSSPSSNSLSLPLAEYEELYLTSLSSMCATAGA